ncbi:MAG: hypothetical protein ACOYI4_05580 [Christensenellales bacterium]|jgi:preprotein translocase subunit SecF
MMKGKYRLLTIIGCLLIMVGAVLALVAGFNYGPDLRGGAQMTVNFVDRVEAAGVEAALKRAGALDAPVVMVEKGKSSYEALITLRDDYDSASMQTVQDRIMQEIQADYPFAVQTDYDVKGPTIAPKTAWTAALALLIAAALIFIYSVFRIQFGGAFTVLLSGMFSVGLMLALSAIFRVEVGRSFLIATLMTMGYSVFTSMILCGTLRDTIQDFENQRKKATVLEIAQIVQDGSKKRVLTCGIAGLIIVALMLALGSVAVVQLALPLLLGVLAVTYAALFFTLPLRYQLMGKRTAKKN